MKLSGSCRLYGLRNACSQALHVHSFRVLVAILSYLCEHVRPSLTSMGSVSHLWVGFHSIQRVPQENQTFVPVTKHRKRQGLAAKKEWKRGQTQEDMKRRSTHLYRYLVLRRTLRFRMLHVVEPLYYNLVASMNGWLEHAWAV